MGTIRRQFCSGMVYEICFRAKRGIPLPARPLMNQLIKSALARTQRDYKVIICTFVWMGNHPHIIVVSRDIEELTKFYGELKKRITESVKRLLGLRQLTLWEESGATVPVVLDINEAASRMVYIFTNPTAAKLVTSIDKYPGLSTWKAFNELPADIKSEATEQVPWIHMDTIPDLPNPQFSKNEENRALRIILEDENNQERFPLIISPFAWLAAYGVTEPEEIQEYRSNIIERVREKEEELAKERAKTGRGVMGHTRLLAEGISFDHVPTKKGRRIFVLSSTNEWRINFILNFRAFCEECRDCYELMKLGHKNIEWPPGAFVPPAPILMNPIEL